SGRTPRGRAPPLGAPPLAPAGAEVAMAAMLLPWAFLVAAVRPGLSADLVLSYIQVPTGDIRIGQEFTVKVWRSAGEFDNGGDKILLSPKGVMCGTEDSLPLPGYLAQDYVEEGNLAKRAHLPPAVEGGRAMH
ncbi:unnamed protein product, partial [Prorocentrum cordatum]